MKTAIHWFRRDLRITDNTALTAAARRAEKVVPIYVLSDWRGWHAWTGMHRQAFLCGCLESLSQNLRAIGGRLIVRQGDAVWELANLVRETGAEAIFFNRDPDPFGRQTEKRLFEAGVHFGIEVVACKDVCLHERDEVTSSSRQPYRVFTPFARAWSRLEKPKPMGKVGTMQTPPGLFSLPLPEPAVTWGLTGSTDDILPAGEKAARARLGRFIEHGLACYEEDRNALAGQKTSRLSQDLRFGLVSIREVFSRCVTRAEKLPVAGRGSAQKFLAELAWREFYMQILWHFPSVVEQEFNPDFRGMAWPGKPADFERWRDGETGFPIVDAAMRQLNQTGFMPNRARMIVAMFLTKDLHLDWRLGEGYFMRQLTDGEIASNNGGWQWSAGTGADAAPYFRIQNPWTQTQRYDPRGEYIRQWLPELRDVSASKLQMPSVNGHPLSKNYPTPMVDHAEARAAALVRYARVRRGCR